MAKTHAESAYDLLDIVRRFAPTGTEQLRLVEMYSNAALDGASDLDLLKMWAGILNDGLNHGNWPWSDYSSRTAGTSEKSGVPQKVGHVETVLEDQDSPTWGPWGKEGRSGN